MEAPSFDRDGRMAETFTWSGSKIPFFLIFYIHFSYLMTGKMENGDGTMFAFSFPRREEENWQGSIEIREEETWLDSQSILRKRWRRSKQIRFTELS